MKKITGLKILENYRVWLRFNDGAEGEVDFSSKPRTGVFSFWNSYENFRKARIGDFGELLWNDQLDFCPDSLWLQITGQKTRSWSACWSRILLILSIIFFSIGLFKYFYQGKETVHRETGGNNGLSVSWIMGIQYETKGKGFYVGKEVSVRALIHTQDLQTYQQFTNRLASTGNKVLVENSEDPKTAKQDISSSLKNFDLKHFYHFEEGVACVTESDGTNIMLEGKVIPVTEGPLFFGLPLSLKEWGINIEPSSIGDQIETNRLITLLTFITLGVACLSFYNDLKHGSRN